jgi:hypothetical protein
MLPRYHLLNAIPRLLLSICCLFLFAVSTNAQQQKNPASFREFLLQYKGKEVLIVDKTGGEAQFTSGEPSKAYLLTLRDVQNDYIVVTRNVETDKRTFAYPISIIRRIIFQYDNKPYQQIVLEMY